MLVAYETLPEASKIWIYPSSRKFYPQEMEALHEKLTEFVTNWKTEDPGFSASYQLLHNRFIVFVAAEGAVLSNADIDTQVSFVLALQSTYDVVLIDKMNVCFKQGMHVQYKDLKEFKKLLKNRAVTAKTIVFDNLIHTKEELENFWELPIEDTWYNRFLKK